MGDILTPALGLVRQYAGLLQLLGLVAAALIVAGGAWWGLRRGKLDKLVAAVSWIAAFGFSAEGMYVVVTRKAGVPGGLAVVVFFVAEAFMVNAMIHAGRQYRATTIRDAAGVVVSYGTAGKHGRFVWAIALVSGLIVAFSSHNPVEFALRLSLPLGAATQWWTTLTSEDVSRRRGRFAHSPTRLAERWGWFIDGDADEGLAATIRSRLTRRMVAHGHRVQTGLVGGWYHRWRLTRLARGADESVVDEVVERLDRARLIVDRLTNPGKTLADQPTFTAAEPEKVAPAKPSPSPRKSTVRAEKVAPRKSGARIGRPSAAEKVIGFAEENPGASVAEVAEKVGVHADTARKYLRELETTFPAETKKSSQVNGVKPDFADAVS